MRHVCSPLALFAALSLLFAAPTVASAQSVGITLVPSIERVRWDDKLAFDDDNLYGGRLALRFGPFVELQPFYFTRDGYGVDSARAGELFGPRSLGQSLDLRHYGTNVQFNLSNGTLVPFVRVGAGVLRLIPDSAPRQDRVTVSAGGGVRFGIGGLNAELFAEQMSFRLRPGNVFGADTSTGKVPTLRNLVYGAALTFPLSSASNADDQDNGLRGTSAPIEPFVGVLRYDGAYGLEDQELAGVRGGIDFSPLFGLRGFYWRGVNDDRDGPADVSGYGGEGQFNLNTGPGISPFLIVGAGQIDYRSEFRDSLGTGRDDQSAFILGGGASVRLSDRLRVNGAIRDYIMSREPELDDLASTGDLTHNTMLTAGLTISFGGSSSSNAARGTTDGRTLRQPEASGRATIDRRDTELALLREELAARERRLLAMERARVEVETDVRSERQTELRVGEPVRSDMSGARWITVPVPVVGEIILRYGMAAGADGRDSVIVRNNALVPLSSTPSGDVMTRLLEIEQRMNARLDAMERRMNAAARGESPILVTPDVRPDAAQVADDRPAPVVRGDRSTVPVFQRFGSTRPRDLQPYLGLGFGDDATQLVLGLRADLGPLNAGSRLNFVPELALGVGDGTSLLAMANVQYAFGSLGGSSVVRPYFTFGGGIFSPSVLGVNTAVGTSFALQRNAASPWFLNVELQGINLFDHTRLLFSLRRSQ